MVNERYLSPCANDRMIEYIIKGGRPASLILLFITTLLIKIVRSQI